MVYSNSRGHEASGIAVFSNQKKVDLIRSDLKSKKFFKSNAFKKFSSKVYENSVRSIIGHTRLATNGIQLEGKNNQPVVSKQKRLVGIHNGIVTNTAQLSSSKSLVNDCPDLDSQLLFDYLESLISKKSLKAALSKLYNDLEGSASIAAYAHEDKSLILATNTGSLYFAEDVKNGVFYFASEKIFLEKSLPVSVHKRVKIQHLKPLNALILSPENEIRQISLTEFEARGWDNTYSLNINTVEPQINDYSVNENLSLAKQHYVVSNSLNALQKHDFDYKSIHNIKRCKKCILPETTPFIDFDIKGVCNYCRDHRKISYSGKDKLEDVLKQYRKNDGSPDCLAAFSGGRDSSYGLHYLKEELGMTPLAYTYDWGMVTDIARRNQARILGKLGIEHILLSADITKKRKHIRENILAWMKNPHLGMVPLFMEGDKQCEFYADQIMKKYNIKLMFFFRGNELEKDEFKTGTAGVPDADPGGVIHNLAFMNKLKLFSFYVGQYLKNPAYFNSSFFDTSLGFYSTYIQKHDYLYLWHYIKWDEDEIINTLTQKYNWEVPTETSATWRTDDGTSSFYNYIYYHGMGFTENDSFRSRQIREGILERGYALQLVHEENRPRYKDLRWYFDKVGLDGDKVLEVVDNIKPWY